MSKAKTRKLERVKAIFDKMLAKVNASLEKYDLDPIRDAFTRIEDCEDSRGHRVMFYFDGDAYDYFGFGDGYLDAERRMEEAQEKVEKIDDDLTVEQYHNCAWAVYI